MPAVTIRETGMSGEMAYSVTYSCPHKDCGRSAVGYAAQSKTTFTGQCDKEHWSQIDTRNS